MPCDIMKYRAEYTLFQRGKSKAAKIWYYRLGSDPNRVAKSTGQTLKHKAKEYVEQEVLSGNKGIPTFNDFTKDFFIWDKCDWTIRQQGKGRAIGKPTADHRRTHVVKHLQPQFGFLRLDKITPKMFESWWIRLAYANQTKNHIKYTMNIIMKEAKRDRLIIGNPIEDVEPMGNDSKQRDALSIEELAALFPVDMAAFMKVWPVTMHGVMYALLVSRGLRPGEARALRWKDIIWDNQGVLVYKAIKATGKEGKTKTKDKGVRAIPLPSRTIELLEWWRLRADAIGLDDLIFEDRNRRTILAHFRHACKNAHINTEGRYIDVYALRHTYSTIMNDLTDEDHVMTFMGHQSKRMTRRYDHPELARRLGKYDGLRGDIEQF